MVTVQSIIANSPARGVAPGAKNFLSAVKMSKSRAPLMGGKKQFKTYLKEANTVEHGMEIPKIRKINSSEAYRAYYGIK